MRTIFKGKKAVTGQSLAASFNSEVLNNYDYSNVLIRIETADISDNTGTFTVQHRIETETEGDEGSWTDLENATTDALANTDAVLSLYLTDLPPGELRVAFAASGVTPNGTCDIWICGRN